MTIIPHHHRLQPPPGAGTPEAMENALRASGLPVTMVNPVLSRVVRAGESSDERGDDPAAGRRSTTPGGSAATSPSAAPPRRPQSQRLRRMSHILAGRGLSFRTSWGVKPGIQ